MTTIPTEPKKRHRLTQEDCDTARLLMARQRTLKEIAEIIGVDPSTVGKIRLADYNLEKYLEQRKAMNQKTKEKKQDREAEKLRLKRIRLQHAEDYRNVLQQLGQEAAGGIAKGVEQVAGQLQMELPEAEEQKKDDQTKMMRFFAAQVDKVLKKLDELIDAIPKGGA